MFTKTAALRPLTSFFFLALFALSCVTAAPPDPAPVAEPTPLLPPPIGAVVGKVLNEHVREAWSETKAVDIHFATNRALLPGATPACSNTAFGITPGDGRNFGICRVNVPKKHAVGNLPVSSNPRADSHTQFRMLTQTALTQQDWLKALSSKGGGEILIFIHGFNVKFEEAIFRAAQITYDAKFQGPVVLVTWPAGAGEGFFEGTMIARTYDANAKNAAQSVSFAADVLRSLADLGPTPHVLVHSMGHQVVLPALAQLAVGPQKTALGEVILNAPDIAVADFTRTVTIIKSLARRITVYCSYNDNAIAASEKYNSGRRMGACERAEGVDVINVGEIDAPTFGVGGLGHGYYASRPILTDVSQVLLGLDAERRLFVRRSEPNTIEDFYLRP